MRVSVCVTTFNEEGTIKALIDSLLRQTIKPAEIILVDGGSKDKTVEIVRKYQKISPGIRLFVRRASRVKGRNIAVAKARANVIAMTDAGCVAEATWLEKITAPLTDRQTDIVAGFYEMRTNSTFQKAASVFLGVRPEKFTKNFLPSARSMAFRKRLWKRVGGFPEKLHDTAEDTMFNYKCVKVCARFARVKSAVVEWGVPATLGEVLHKMYHYAKGDAKTKIWWHPAKGLASHNIKVVSIFGRYGLGIISLYLIVNNYLSPIWLIFAILLYSYWAYGKVVLQTGSWKAGVWGLVLQYSSDFVVMAGLISGIF